LIYNCIIFAYNKYININRININYYINIYYNDL
jgi:hypothetical protein